MPAVIKGFCCDACKFLCALVLMHVQQPAMSAMQNDLYRNGAGFLECSGDKGQGAKQGKRELSHMASDKRQEAAAHRRTLLDTNWILNDLTEIILKSLIN